VIEQMPGLQVSAAHYAWSEYVTRGRWSSYWHQIRLVLERRPTTCLVVGKGDDIVPAVLRLAGVGTTTVDIDPRLEPDTVADVRSLPFSDDEFDCVLAAQVLEHVPFEALDGVVSELRRVTRSFVVASVPQRGRAWELALKLPFLPALRSGGVLPARTRHRFDGQHHWEVGARQLRRGRLEAVLGSRFTIAETLVVPDHPYHRFYVLVA
jgi:SAM-dependent methyltransferase